ncbi:MAG: hypothetical protein QOD83_2755 [Solirubrobacteraceae bacterium]|jgi:hypothetical protein|nr:hypothetical protein [Solirubrobacteraceae bacterium]MEA2182553.1 hypothetical protein [Solirubrobacteraceae bacterium]MEA2185908.1 hypothetical protein [Solirubrobacteraceae bacterium]MEA2232939.1 hypothetical protein [Solirubrobacteraceae bacterium]
MRRRVTALLVAAAAAATVTPVAASSSVRSERAAVTPGTVTLNHGQKVYSGSGSQSLGTLRLKRTAKLEWRHPSGGRLRLLTSASRGRQFPLVTTVFRSGSVRLRAGTYRGLRVLTRGGWRISITTQ